MHRSHSDQVGISAATGSVIRAAESAHIGLGLRHRPRHSDAVSDQRRSSRSSTGKRKPGAAPSGAKPSAGAKKSATKATAKKSASGGARKKTGAKARTKKSTAKTSTAKTSDAKRSGSKRSSGKKRAAAAEAGRRATAVAEAVRGLVVGFEGRVTELEAGRDYRFGRDPACDVVALDSLVSRAHCQVRWDADHLWILEDLGSANGTWLNEHKLDRPRVLSDDDVFRIGGQEYRFRFVPPGMAQQRRTAEPPDARKRTVSDESSSRSAAVSADPALAGSFSAIDLPQLMCYLALAGRSGRLSIDDDLAAIDFVGGVPRAARYARHQGIEALRELAAADLEQFEFAPDVHLDDAAWTITGSPEAVMLAAFGPADRPHLDPADLAKAGAQQRRSMPDAPAVDGLAIGITYQALGGVGGDFYELAELADGRQLALIGDVSGHGVQGALVVAGLLRSLRYLAPACDDLRELAAGLDRDSHRDLLPGQFATAVMAAIDVASGRTEVLLSGHHPARLVRPGQLPRPVGRIGPAIGLSGLRLDPGRLQPDPCTLDPDATLVLFSDALLEARDHRDREFGDHGLDAALEALAAATDLQRGVADLAAACRRFAGTVDDDLSILALRRR